MTRQDVMECATLPTLPEGRQRPRNHGVFRVTTDEGEVRFAWDRSCPRDQFAARTSFILLTTILKAFGGEKEIFEFDRSLNEIVFVGEHKVCPMQ